MAALFAGRAAAGSRARTLLRSTVTSYSVVETPRMQLRQRAAECRLAERSQVDRQPRLAAGQSLRQGRGEALIDRLVDLADIDALRLDRCDELVRVVGEILGAASMYGDLMAGDTHLLGETDPSGLLSGRRLLGGEQHIKRAAVTANRRRR
jgi:hypothetical protein